MATLRSKALTAAVLIGIASTAQAQLVTTADPGMTGSINLTGACTNTFSGGPFALNDGIVVTSSNPSAVLCWNSGYGLLGNGVWNSAIGPYAGLNTGSGYMRFTFVNPIAMFGANVNWIRDGGSFWGPNAFIEALDASNNVLNSYNVNDISTPNGTNAFAFRGIVHSTNDIYAIQFRDGGIVADNIVYGNVSAVPEPATMTLLASGLIGLAGAARRRRRATVEPS